MQRLITYTHAKRERGCQRINAMEKKYMKLVVVLLMCIVVFWGCGSQRRKDTTEI
jgi:hypothetical protein